jgi:hypothetical protein
LYNREVRDVEFVQRVRRHIPASLVPLVARYGAMYATPDKYQNRYSALYAPWVLAEVARVSLIHGTAFNRKLATDSDLRACCAACQALRDPELGSGGPEAVGRFLLRAAGQQLVFQQSAFFNDLARPVALFEQTKPRRALPTLDSGWPRRLLGCTLQEYLSAAFVLHTGALKNSGTFDLEWLTQPQFAEVTREVPAHVLCKIIEDHYVATPDQLREMQREAERKAGTPDPQYRRFGFNPLASRPAVAGLASTLLIPVPAFVFRQASPLGLYYTGLAQWGTAFANDLGELFEAYVGLQLGLLPDALVLPEISYGKSGDRSVDWFVVFEDCVVLVEVKSTRPTEPVRLADASAGDTLKRVLGRAVEQLNRSAALVRDRQAGFAAVPDDRPLLGLVVTMEPFHTVNMPRNAGYLPACDIPFRVCGVLELEQLVTVSDVSLGRLLLDHLTDPQKDGWSARSALEGHTQNRNAVLDAAWATFPWKDEPEVSEPS